MSNKPTYHLKSRIWICTDEGTFLGEGRISLLKLIEQEGSISKAAKAMNMSYKKAWELVNSMNEQAESPLVICATGGQHGGGSKLSEAGFHAINLFESINAESKEFLQLKLNEQLQ